MVTDHGPAGNLLGRARALCEPVLREAVDWLPVPLRHLAGYHFGWWDVTGTAVRAPGGKSLRSALAICAAVACGSPPSAAVHAGAALELLHNFTLVHDDVMDADVTRHGRATVGHIWGASSAVLLGDALHAMAIRVLATGLPALVAVDAVARLETAAAEMCHGQYEDCVFETREQVGVDDYLRMAAGKTGTLMGCACALGALCGGGDAETVAAMDEFGRELGLAFQIVDDMIGIWGDPGVSGKPAGNDLACRKRSMPVVAALGSGTDSVAELSNLYLSNAPMTLADVARATALIETAGGKAMAQRYADERLTAAIATLPSWSAAGELIALAQLVTHRDK
ncbi:geranylgeranyl diphosphate synthase IdsB [Nocardia brasiliensis]|uniref:geranylgeranyl diphosphate synthase IdsB n=1 Tax=Nocardia brasiliensis TaxID=37326 RepID=UPI003D76F548